MLGHLGGSVGWTSNFGSGHDLTVCKLEPHIGLCADWLRAWNLLRILCVCVCVSLSAPPPLMLSPSLSLCLSRQK